jgi:hypothetical protein
MRLTVHSGRLRALFASGCVLAVLAVAPAAHASTVSEANGTLSVVTAPGEANNVTIVEWGMALKVTDSGTKRGVPIALTVGMGCFRLSSNSATCARPSKGVSVNLGDGDDVADLRDGVTDSLVCGPGNDSGNAETDDSVAPDCEAVTKPVIVTPVDPPPVTVDPPADPVVDPPVVVTTPPVNSVPPTIPPQTVGISSSGVATVVVACPADSGGCKGVVTIALPGAAAARHAKVAAAGKAAALKIGSTNFKVAAGKSKKVPVRLSKRGRQRILRGRTRRARISVTTQAADGTTTVTTQDVTLHPKKAKKAKARKRRKAHHL